jgi:undecaprenyl diphosphate synthase
MSLLQRYLKQEVPLLNKNNIRLAYIGRERELPPAVQECMAWARDATAQNTGMVLTLALNYSARTELVDAVNGLMRELGNNGASPCIGEQDIARHLYTRGLPELDLVIRTSGEMRLSNFLLWQVAYAEIYVTTTLWPDFRGINLLQAIGEFQKRERRYGGLPEPAPEQCAAAAASAAEASNATAK